MVSYFELRFLLCLAGMRIQSVSTARWGHNSVLLAPFLALLVILGTRRILRGLRESHPAEYAEILSHVLSPAVLLGKKLVLVARKVGPPRFSQR